MIYSVHFWYHKIRSRKAENKFEGLVFASDDKRVAELIKAMLLDFPVEAEPFNIICGNRDATIDEIYIQRPELRGISPEQGCILDEFRHRKELYKYVK
jgi:hypothetical protein